MIRDLYFYCLWVDPTGWKELGFLFWFEWSVKWDFFLVQLSVRVASAADKLCQWDANPCSTEEEKMATELGYSARTQTPHARTHTLFPFQHFKHASICWGTKTVSLLDQSLCDSHTPPPSDAARRASGQSCAHKLNQANHPRKNPITLQSRYSMWGFIQ